MKPETKEVTINIPGTPEIKIETGKIARQAHGSVVVSMGETMLLATVVSNYEQREGANFLPLSVDYQEKFASSGRIPGSFMRREGKLSDYEVLTSRLVDRALRPLFPKKYYYDTQVNIFLISAGDNQLPDALTGLAASAALMVSDIPFNGPVSEVRVAKIDGKLVINPTISENEKATMDLIVAGTKDAIMMVEGEMKEISEAEMLEAIEFGHKAIVEHCAAQENLRAQCGVITREYQAAPEDTALEAEIKNALEAKLIEFTKEAVVEKHARKEGYANILEAYVETLPDEVKEDEDRMALIKEYYSSLQKEVIRNLVMDQGFRLDGRATNEIRPIWIEVGYLPTAHGSALFTRGETQSLTTVTLGSKLDEQLVDGAIFKGTSKFLLHYNFPSFSTGEVRPNRGPGRREVGHGNLAFRALKNVLPQGDENPYTIRIVSDILESNGSSSMATVCAGSLALMDAGMPLPEHVSGIAMGLISDPETGRYAILSDILGDEDHLGDMDFKVTGTSKGITACQMDLKIKGISPQVMQEALEQARQGRMHILGKMATAISEPRNDLKPNAPRTKTLPIDKDCIGALIGPGGKIIQEIQRESHSTIVIDELENEAKVTIFATNQPDMDVAVKRVSAIAAMPELDQVYEGKVKGIKPYGGFIEFMPGKDGFLHISEVAWERTNSMDDAMKVGDTVKVKLIEIDKKNNQFRLSIKALTPKPE